MLLNHVALVTKLLERSITNPIQIINLHLKKLQNIVKILIIIQKFTFLMSQDLELIPILVTDGLKKVKSEIS